VETSPAPAVGREEVSLVGVFVHNAGSIATHHQTGAGRFCDFVGHSLKGESPVVSDDQIDCPLARYVFGIDPSSEEMIETLVEKPLGWGTRDIEIAMTIIESIPRLTMDRRILEFAPIPSCIPEFDVTLWVGPPSAAMERVIGFSYGNGQQTHARLNGVGALCGECVGGVLRVRGPVLSLGCRGSRLHAGIRDDELILVMPGVFAERE